MANKKHLAILKKGVAAWNEWRKQNPDIRPDPREDLDWRGPDLSGANLSRADLSTALLVESNLEDAVLDGCRIYGISAWNVKLSKHTRTTKT